MAPLILTSFFRAPDDQTAQGQSIDQKSVSSSGIEMISMNKTPEGPKFNKIKVRQNAIMGQVPQKIINANNPGIVFRFHEFFSFLQYYLDFTIFFSYFRSRTGCCHCR